MGVVTKISFPRTKPGDVKNKPRERRNRTEMKSLPPRPQNNQKGKREKEFSIQSIASIAAFSSRSSKSRTSVPIITASSTSKCSSTPLGRLTGPSPRTRIDDGGFKKKNGRFGRALCSSAMWSLTSKKTKIKENNKKERESPHYSAIAQCLEEKAKMIFFYFF